MLFINFLFYRSEDTVLISDSSFYLLVSLSVIAFLVPKPSETETDKLLSHIQKTCLSHAPKTQKMIYNKSDSKNIRTYCNVLLYAYSREIAIHRLIFYGLNWYSWFGFLIVLRMALSLDWFAVEFRFIVRMRMLTDMVAAERYRVVGALRCRSIKVAPQTVSEMNRRHIFTSQTLQYFQVGIFMMLDE